MRSQLTIFTKNLLILAVIIVVADFGIGKALSYIYFNQKTGTRFRTTYTLDSTNAKMLILGSSRASHHFNSNLLSERITTTTYNCGRDGTNIIYASTVLKSILKRYKPSTIILDLNSSDFYKIPGNNENLLSLLPYYESHPEIQKALESRNDFESIKLLSKIYPFNSSIVSAISEKFKVNEKDINGFMPLKGYDNSIVRDTLDLSNFEKNYQNFYYLKQIAEDCNDNGVKLIVIQSPRLTFYKNDFTRNIVNEILSKSSFRYINFINNPIYLNNPKFFKDQAHLNQDGADFFTKQVSFLLNKTSAN
jgi:hypothetical protein